MLPTTPAGLTVQGTILGTVQYMAPEQIEGQEADGRTDIFAFGAVLYEMLTGTKAFTGASPASLISSILSSQPPKVSTVQTLAPAELDHLIARCLAKGPDNRWQSARDVVLELEWIRSTPFTNVTGRKPRSRWIIGRTVAAALVGVFVGGTGVWMNRPSSAVAPMVRLAVPLLDTASIVTYLNGAPLAIAPDGSRVAFIGHAGSGRLLYVRRMADLEGAPIPGTELAEQPFFSPDGDWIAFFTGDRLKKVSVTGGPVSTICVLPSAVVVPRGGDWGPDGTIIFAMSSQGLYRVSANGGVPERIVAPDPKANEVSYDFPQILSDRGAILYTVYHAGPVH